MRDALAAIDGYSFRAAYGTLSEEAEPEPTVLAQAPPPESLGPPAQCSPSTVKGPVRQAIMMYSAAPAYSPLTIPWTATWPYEDAFPDPLTIELAREHLVEAF